MFNRIQNYIQPNNTALNLGIALGIGIAGKSLYDVFKRYQSPSECPFPHVPTIVSPKAQEYLKTATPVGGLAMTSEVMPMIRNGFRAATIEESNKAKKEYLEKIENITIANVPVQKATPKNYSKPEEEKVLIYMHGGAFTLGSPDHLCQIYAQIAKKANMITYAIDYRLAPEHPFPAGLNDCIDVYKELLKTHKPENIFFFGDSAGANLCIATILKCRDMKLSMPKAVGLNSPLVDSEKNSDSYYSLDGRSPKLQYEKSILPALQAYATKEELKSHLVSVLHGDFKKGFPDANIITGTRDALLSDCVRFDRKLKDSGISSNLEVWDGMWHGFQEHDIPEAKDSASSMAQFFKSHMS